jgi:hypothetical protein
LQQLTADLSSDRDARFNHFLEDTFPFQDDQGASVAGCHIFHGSNQPWDHVLGSGLADSPGYPCITANPLQKATQFWLKNHRRRHQHGNQQAQHQPVERWQGQ